MINIEDECVGCPREMGCMGDSCPNRNVPRLYCDECKDEFETLYDFDGDQLCEECLLKQFDTIDYDNYRNYM